MAEKTKKTADNKAATPVAADAAVTPDAVAQAATTPAAATQTAATTPTAATQTANAAATPAAAATATAAAAPGVANATDPALAADAAAAETADAEFEATLQGGGETAARYTRGEEIFNWVSHLAGVVFAVAALVSCLLVSIVRNAGGYAVVSSLVYGIAMVILYVSSTFYHAIKKPAIKRIFRIFDHCSIFLLIAGTYTPYTLILLRPESPIIGWLMFALVWAGSIVGIVLNAIDIRKFEKFSVVLYLLLGWCVILCFYKVIKLLPGMGLALLICGGVVYTVGAVLYRIGRKRKYFHSVWHLMVVLGSVLQFLSIVLYVIPLA